MLGAVRSMSSGSSIAKVAVAQLCATWDLEANLKHYDSIMQRAADQSCKMVFFPEATDYMGRNREETISLASNHARLLKHYKSRAKQLGLWVSLGGLHAPSVRVAFLEDDDSDRRVFNRHLILNADGEEAGRYDKLHLFEVDIPGKVTLSESSFSRAGSQLVAPADTPVGRVAMGICYDLRFPELSLWQRAQGAHILTYPSAFTVPTGEAHWHTLLRARAIETCSYVVAAAQCGQHNPRRSTYGHALIVDPYGKVVADCGDIDQPTLGVVDISLEVLNRTRAHMPCDSHRRPDLYALAARQPFALPSGGARAFGSHTIPAEHIFAETTHSFAFVNLKPVLDGHVLVASKRAAAKLTDLDVAELADLFLCAQQVQRVIERHHSVASTTVTSQDGPDAGQTVAHVHVHILPRRPGDFEDDNDIYNELAQHDKDEKRVARAHQVMADEAAQYRSAAQSRL